MRPRFSIALVMVVTVAACGADEPTGDALPLLPAAVAGDYDPADSLGELADRSTISVIGTLVDIQEGFIFGESADDEFGSRYLELLVDTASDDGLFRLVWPYPAGPSLDAIRAVSPIGARMVIYAIDWDTAFPPPQANYFHVGDGDHVHHVLTTPQGILVEDPATGTVQLGDPSAPFDDAPAAGATLDAWLVAPGDELLPFEQADFDGLCESLIADFVEDEPGPHASPEEAAAEFASDYEVLQGLDLVDGTIVLRGEPVGSYSIADRAEGTFSVESAEWCYPD